MNWSIIKNGNIELQPRSWSSKVFSKKLHELGRNTSLTTKEPEKVLIFGEIRIVPVRYVTPELNQNEILQGITYEVSDNEVVGTYGKRAKTEDEINPGDSAEVIKRKMLENKYLEATKSLMLLAGDTIGDGVWPKLEDVDFETKASLAAVSNASQTSLLLSTLNYTFFQLKLLRWDWEKIEYRPEINN